MNFLAIVLAALSIWDYPARQPMHERLSSDFVLAVRCGDTAKMEALCRKGVALLPDDPTWRYNLACSLAYFPKRKIEALNELEAAIDLGFRDANAIENDNDLKRLSRERRFGELVKYAREMSTKPLLTGPMASIAVTEPIGGTVVLGDHNLGWDFDSGSFIAKLNLKSFDRRGNAFDLYMNRDSMHSTIVVTNFPGLTAVRLDKDARQRGVDLNAPNMLFPYPVFGNSSRAFVNGPYWRSISRALVTTESHRLKAMMKYYLSNQTWVFPSNADTAPVGTNGDVFASITPYWMTSAGRSWSDRQYVIAALKASAEFASEVKQLLVQRQMLAPTIQTLIRKSLKDVKGEADYLTAAAHPTALPPSGVDIARLKKAAAEMTKETIPPLVAIDVEMAPVAVRPKIPEITYSTPFAWAFVLRARENARKFKIRARGAEEFSFTHTHGAADVKIDRLSANEVRITIDRSELSPTNRIDITVVGRNAKTGWGAPAYVSFAVVDPKAPYSDPALMPNKR